jgi:hypothetical protein
MQFNSSPYSDTLKSQYLANLDAFADHEFTDLSGDVLIGSIHDFVPGMVELH